MIVVFFFSFLQNIIGSKFDTGVKQGELLFPMTSNIELPPSDIMSSWDLRQLPAVITDINLQISYKYGNKWCLPCLRISNNNFLTVWQ